MQDHQIEFFKLIKDKALPEVDLVSRIGSLLNLERSAVYNRINGKTRISVDDMMVLIQTFDVEYPLLPSQEKMESIPITFGSLNQQPRTSIEFLIPILGQLQILGLEKKVLIRYVTAEVLLFYFIHFPFLAKFKFFVWKFFTWNRETQLQGTRFFDNHAQVSPDENFYFEVLRTGYDNLPSSEIWHTNILDNTLNQIRYLKDTGLIKDASILVRLYKELHDLLDMMESRTAAGRKPTGAPYQLFHNEATHTNNIILVEAGYQSVVYFTFDNPNLCRSTDERLLTYTRDAIDNLERHCIPLSVTSEKARNSFFSTLHDKVRAYE